MRLFITDLRNLRLQRTLANALIAMSLSFSSSAFADATAGDDKAKMEKIVDQAVAPLIRDFKVPGMAVGITVKGKRYFFNFGVSSLAKGKPISDETLFEIGSVSKTFAASLASYAIVNGALKLSDKVSASLPDLKGTAFDHISVLNLATHTSGGLPLQVPEAIHDDKQLLEYLKHWKPDYAPGTYRIYSNPSIGLLGMVAAKCFDQTYEKAVDTQLFSKLGMTHSFMDVPAERMADYAQGYTASGAPTRSSARVLSSGAYGVKSCALDMIQYLEANMSMHKLDEKLQQALIATHQPYFKCGVLTQDLAWEQFSIPVKSKTILAGSSDALVHRPNVVTRISPSPQAEPTTDVLIHKTGSTNGCSCYVVFIPSKKLGLVLLANKNLEIAPRLSAACQILSALDGGIINEH